MYNMAVSPWHIVTSYKLISFATMWPLWSGIKLNVEVSQSASLFSCLLDQIQGNIQPTFEFPTSKRLNTRGTSIPILQDHLHALFGSVSKAVSRVRPMCVHMPVCPYSVSIRKNRLKGHIAMDPAHPYLRHEHLFCVENDAADSLKPQGGVNATERHSLPHPSCLWKTTKQATT